MRRAKLTAIVLALVASKCIGANVLLQEAFNEPAGSAIPQPFIESHHIGADNNSTSEYFIRFPPFSWKSEGDNVLATRTRSVTDDSPPTVSGSLSASLPQLANQW